MQDFPTIHSRIVDCWMTYLVPIYHRHFGQAKQDLEELTMVFHCDAGNNQSIPSWESHISIHFVRDFRGTLGYLGLPSVVITLTPPDPQETGKFPVGDRACSFGCMFLATMLHGAPWPSRGLGARRFLDAADDNGDHLTFYSTFMHLTAYGSVSKPCTPVVHIKIAGIYGCSSQYWPIPI